MPVANPGDLNVFIHTSCCIIVLGHFSFVIFTLCIVFKYCMYIIIWNLCIIILCICELHTVIVSCFLGYCVIILSYVVLLCYSVNIVYHAFIGAEQ